MNGKETALAYLVVGIGLGLGFWLIPTHGKIGFLFGFLGGTGGSILLIGIIRALLPSKPNQKSHQQSQE